MSLVKLTSVRVVVVPAHGSCRLVKMSLAVLTWTKLIRLERTISMPSGTCNIVEDLRTSKLRQSGLRQAIDSTCCHFVRYNRGRRRDRMQMRPYSRYIVDLHTRQTSLGVTIRVCVLCESIAVFADDPIVMFVSLRVHTRAGEACCETWFIPQNLEATTLSSFSIVQDNKIRS